MKNVKGGKGNTKSELIERGEITNLRERVRKTEESKGKEKMNKCERKGYKWIQLERKNWRAEREDSHKKEIKGKKILEEDSRGWEKRREMRGRNFVGVLVLSQCLPFLSASCYSPFLSRSYHLGKRGVFLKHNPLLITILLKMRSEMLSSPWPLREHEV